MCTQMNEATYPPYHQFLRITRKQFSNTITHLKHKNRTTKNGTHTDKCLCLYNVISAVRNTKKKKNAPQASHLHKPRISNGDTTHRGPQPHGHVFFKNKKKHE